MKIFGIVCLMAIVFALFYVGLLWRYDIVIKQRDTSNCQRWLLVQQLLLQSEASDQQLDALRRQVDTMALDADVAMENSNRLRANLESTEDFADALKLRLDQFETRAVLDGRSTPIGKTPGWPQMRPMVHATFRTNSAGLVVVQVKEVGR